MMDRVVDWFGSAAMGMLLENVSSYLSQDSKELHGGMRKELERLEICLSQFQSALVAAEKHNLCAGDRNSALERWRWELRDAVEEVEDVLDEIEYYRIESQVIKNKSAKQVCASSSGIKRKFSELVGKLWPSSDPILDKLREAIHKLDVVKTDAKGLIDIFSVPNALTSDNYLASHNDQTTSNRETGHMLTVDKFFGRDQEKEAVMKWLMKPHSEKNISALTICGMGGLGKTTLCQVIFNDECVKDYFQVKIWICVSNQPDAIKQILTKAIEYATGSAPSTRNLSVLQNALLTIVKGKKFLLVLDDVWEDTDLKSWENFVAPLKHGNKGSKILITTRLVSVGKIVVQVLSIENLIGVLRSLGEDYCTSLFNKHAFAGVNSDDYKDLQIIGNKIIKKCGGLPLVVKLMGGLLRTNLNYSYWENVWEYDILKLKDGLSDALEVLKISYRHLPPHLQSCFRLCSIYTQDYQFKKEELVHLWAGAGLIQQTRNDKRLIEEIGHEYFNSLLTRSLFQFAGNLLYDDETWVMHDLVHDLARVMSEGECLAVESDKFDYLPKTLRHLSISMPTINGLRHLSYLRKLRTLNIECNGKSPDLNNLFTEALAHLPNLRVLCFKHEECDDGLTPVVNLDGIKYLKHLRHLNWVTRSHGKQWFPESTINTLYHLQYLSYSDIYPMDFTNGIKVDGLSNLIKLRHLNIPDPLCKQMTQIQHLIELQKVNFYVKKDGDSRLCKLKHLNNLHILNIYSLQNLVSPAEAMDVDLYAKKHLQELLLSWRHEEETFNKQMESHEETQYDPEFHEQVLCYLQPQSNIKNLALLLYCGRTVPSWMTSHNNLTSIVRIELLSCKNIEQLPPLGHLSSLKVLHLVDMPAVKKSGMGFYGDNVVRGFPSLKELTIDHMENFEEWTGAYYTDWFPHLKILEVSGCIKLNELPSLPLSLVKLNLHDVGLNAPLQWQGLNINQGSSSSSSLLPNKIKSALHSLQLTRLPNIRTLFSKQIFSTFPALHFINLGACQSLTSLDGLCGLTSIRSLSISGCYKLTDMVELPSTLHEDTFSFLVEDLVIDDAALLQIEPLRHIKSAKRLSIKFNYKEESFVMAKQWLLQNCNSLIKLSFFRTPLLRFLPENIQMLGSLKIIHFEDAPQLESLPHMPCSLKVLLVHHCPRLLLLPDLPSTIKILVITDCPLLKERYQKDVGFDWPKISHIEMVRITEDYSQLTEWEKTKVISSSLVWSTCQSRCPPI